MPNANAHDVWFIAAPAPDDCVGCLFESELGGVCDAACAAAVAAGLPECTGKRGESVCIYVRDPSDGRQADLLTP